MFAKLARLGPGLLYAGAAVGVSHLVQSTRAGANYGWLMVFVVVLANVLKYPFFKAGPIYAAIHGQSILEGFYKKGKAAMLLFYVLTFSNLFAVQAAITLITASLIATIFKVNMSLWIIASLVLLASGILL